jgi:hypothetical protein
MYPSDVDALSFEKYKGKQLRGISQRQKCSSLKMSKNMNKRSTENYIFKFLTVSSMSSDSIVKESLMTLSTRL